MRQFCPHPALLHVDPFEPIIDEDLAPGDILYIPPGFPHDGFTHETALNYSVGFRGPNGRDLISSFADYALENDLGGEHYSDPDLTCREHPGRVEQYELDRIRQMMIDMISKPDDFTKWFGSFVSTPRHELDIAAAEPPYTPEEVLDALQGGETLSRLSGLRVLNINGSFFINSEQLETVDAKAADALCRYTELGQAELGDALKNPAFVEELTGLINQGTGTSTSSAARFSPLSPVGEGRVRRSGHTSPPPSQSQSLHPSSSTPRDFCPSAAAPR
jgi:50S ribosomal protein L16 3-hydroxylase